MRFPGNLKFNPHTKSNIFLQKYRNIGDIVKAPIFLSYLYKCTHEEQCYIFRLLQTWQWGESQDGLWTGTRAWSKLCWCSGRPSHTWSECTEDALYPGGCEEIVQSIYHRFSQSNGVKSPCQPFLLQERLHKSSASCTSCLPQHRKWGNEGRELLPTCTRLPRSEWLHPGVPILLSGLFFKTKNICCAKLVLVLVSILK